MRQLPPIHFLAAALLAGSVFVQTPSMAKPPPPPPGSGDDSLGTEAPSVIVDRSLMITDLAVIEDSTRTDPTAEPAQPWTFRHLMEQMAGDNDPAELTLRWLETWEQDQHVNGGTIPARTEIRQQVIDPWLQASGGDALDLSKAPFKLLAIVNRIDLREHDRRRVATAGEGRFVFGLLDSEGQPLPPIAGTQPGGFLVIFEYEMLADNMDLLHGWAEGWQALSEQTPGSDEYNEALEALTRRWTDAGSAPGKTNGSALNQIRTNEVALGLPWELREFVIDYETGLLRPFTTALTPDTISLNGTPTLAALINANERALLDERFELPQHWFGGGSLSGPFLLNDFPDSDQRSFTVNPFFPPFYDIPWSASGIINNDARHAFALNTCGGCHRDETGTNFAHVGFPVEHGLPLSLGQPAALSGFLSGIDVADPVNADTTRGFADLERRRHEFTRLLQDFGRDARGPDEHHKPRFVH